VVVEDYYFIPDYWSTDTAAEYVPDRNTAANNNFEKPNHATT
jgi:hypothetical protein